MSNLPKPLQDVVERFSSLPGIGPKSALRMAMAILKWPEVQAQGLGQSILALRKSLAICSQCGSLADSDPCPICSDPARYNGQICVVGEWDSLLVMEEAGGYRGRYFILGGLLSPLDGVQPQDLEIDRLKAFLRQDDVRELILALGTTGDAEATGSYLKNMVDKEFPQVSITRLAQGIPLGSEVKYMDRNTLRQSLQYRQAL
ncbi:MAG: recombination mediator RecR [Desulfoplanes sp.]|nr:recombination mediator RecR [Desulfoplanes sp.]MDD4649622.1 recombination mediator RecR [Desulfoplanes sp.]